MVNASKEDEDLATALILVGCGLEMKYRKKYRQKKRVWVNEWMKQRSERDHYNNIMQELRFWDSAGYRRFLKMDFETFEV